MKNCQPNCCNTSTSIAPTVLRGLASHGYSITGQRRSLVEYVVSCPRHFTADELLRDLQTEGVKVGRATVFRTLDILEQMGYVSRVRDGGRMAYTACTMRDHHHHLVCSQCGQVLHLEGCPVSELLEELQSRTGYRIQHHNLEVAGVCPDCQK
ncbi:MAG: Fur family transcriptional regulator [Chloroflexota bacterium]|jgi:Fur family ferric uptake transcriptional regulator